jgi:hypothetical protein
MAACHPEADGSSNDAHVSLMLQNPPDDSRNDAHVSLMQAEPARRQPERRTCVVDALETASRRTRIGTCAPDRGLADSTIDTSAVITPETAQLD